MNLYIILQLNMHYHCLFKWTPSNVEILPDNVPSYDILHTGQKYSRKKGGLTVLIIILVFAVYTVFNSYNYFYIGDVLSVLTIVNINWEKKIMVISLLH